MDGKHLIEKALSARRYAYAPYSNFFVGAALLCRNGKIYTGCNVETSTFTPTSCAERTAFVKALSEGEREFVAIAVVGGRGEEKTRGFVRPAECADNLWRNSAGKISKFSFPTEKKSEYILWENCFRFLSINLS